MVHHDREMSASCAGVAAQIKTFVFLFGVHVVHVGENLLGYADVLSKSSLRKDTYVCS